MASDWDLIVIGAGNAGQAAAGVARQAGWKVLVVEGRDVGGTCPLRGCVPKKVLVAAAETLDAISRAGAHGIAVARPELDFRALMDRKQSFVDGVAASMEKSLRDRGIEVAHGRARFVDRLTIEVAGQRHTARKIVVATGSKPRPLPLPGADLLIGSDEVLELQRRPEAMVFVGAGVIALEFTHVFARAGTRVTLLELEPRPLPALDEDAVGRLAAATRALGVDLLTSARTVAIEKRGGGKVVRFEQEGRTREVTADVVVNGAGRIADLADLDLTAAGIAVRGHAVRVDEHLRSVDHPDVFFAGDALAGTPQLSPVATYEGRIVGRNLTKDVPETPDYGSIPSVVFTVPALASVGPTEPVAREQGLAFETKANDLESWRSARTYAETAAYAKVLVERKTQRILAAHLLGHGAAETIHAFAMAIRHGLTADEIKETVWAYPTFHSDLKFLV